MKKIISLILILSISVALAACGSKPNSETTTEIQTTAAQAEVDAQPTIKLDDNMARLGKLVKLAETPFVLKSLVLKNAENAQGNYNTFKPGENIDFYINADIAAADEAKVKIHLAPYSKDANSVPSECVFSAEYKAAAEEGGVNLTAAIPGDTADGYYNIIFAYENTVAYRIAIKIAK